MLNPKLPPDLSTLNYNTNQPTTSLFTPIRFISNPPEHRIIKIMKTCQQFRETAQKPCVDIAFQDISFWTEPQQNSKPFCLPSSQKQNAKPILSRISGIFKAGQISAIMGPSGCGKTSLLNILAGRVPSERLSGTISVNGLPFSQQHFGDFGNYVMQDDILIQTLTVRETLKFAADLRLRVPEAEKISRVEFYAKKLKLQKCLDVVVGGSMVKGVSGGERKRTSIAYELITDPAVLILDEPTSGLDSLTSYIIVEYFKQLAESESKTIILSIHQPNAEIFSLFDTLLLLAEGQPVYQGPCAAAVHYFSQQFALTCPQFCNPADYLLSIVEAKTYRTSFPAYYSTYNRLLRPAVDQQISAQRNDSLAKREGELDTCPAIKILLYRDLTNLFRNPLLIKLRFFLATFLSLFTAGLYYHLGGNYESPADWKAVVGILFLFPIGMLLLSFTQISVTFPSERLVFIKERQAKLYGPLTYFLSRSLIQIPYTLFFPLYQGLIFYFLTALSPTAPQFFTFYLVGILTSFAGSSLGLMLGSIASDSKTVSALTPLFIQPTLLFAGYYKNLDSIPRWLGWIQYLSPVKYGFSAALQNEVLLKKSPISQLNFNTGIWESIALLIAIGLLYRVLSFVFLWKFSRRFK